MSLPASGRFDLVPVRPRVLSVRTIADVAPALGAALGLPSGMKPL